MAKKPQNITGTFDNICSGPIDADNPGIAQEFIVGTRRSRVDTVVKRVSHIRIHTPAANYDAAIKALSSGEDRGVVIDRRAGSVLYSIAINGKTGRIQRRGGSGLARGRCSQIAVSARGRTKCSRRSPRSTRPPLDRAAGAEGDRRGERTSRCARRASWRTASGPASKPPERHLSTLRIRELGRDQPSRPQLDKII